MQLDGLRARLEGTRFSDLRHVATTGSTNADLVASARSGGDACALVADHQDAGRGRLDRTWVAPPGASLLMSVLVPAPFPAAGPQLLGTALGVAAVDSIRELAGVEVGLKWPNDIVATGRGALGADLKVGGLLSELIVAPDGREAAVVGLGLNLHWSDHEFPAELVPTATAIDLLGGRIDRGDLVVELLERMDAVGELATSSVACELLVEQYRDRCVTIGRRVRVELPSAELQGVAVDVALDGSLLVRDGPGDVHTVTVGDVVHLRPL